MESVDRIIYSKTMNWAHEEEYRLVIHLWPGEEPFNTDPYHADEIAELYLGADMSQADASEIIGMARAVNPGISIFQMRRDARRDLTFNRI